MSRSFDIESQFREARHPSVPSDMRERILASIRTEEVADVIPTKRRRQGTIGVVLAGAAAIVVAGVTVGVFAYRANLGMNATTQQGGPTTAANPKNGSSSGRIPGFAVSVGQKTSPIPTSNELATTTPIQTDSITLPGVHILYPQFSGLPDASVQKAVNAKLKELSVPSNLAQMQTNQDTFTSRYFVSYQAGNLIDLVITTQHAPHLSADGGTTTEASLLVNLATGKQYGLQDLFQPGSNYLSILSQAVKQADTNHILGLGQPYPTVKTSDAFALTNNGLAVIFQQNEWAAHAAGTPAFEIPFSQLSSVLNKHGELWTDIQSGLRSKSWAQVQQDLQYMNTKGYQLVEHVPNMYSLNQDEVTLVTPDLKTPIYAFIGYSDKSNVTTAWHPIEKVFFFHGNKYLGTDTLRPHGLVQDMYLGQNGDIAVEYQYQNASGVAGQFTIHYTWDGHSLKASGLFPKNYNNWN